MTKEMERASDDRHRLRFLVDVVVVVTVLIGDQDRKGKREKMMIWRAQVKWQGNGKEDKEWSEWVSGVCVWHQ